MRTFAQKPKKTQQSAFSKSTTTSRSHFGQSREVKSILHLQRMIGNQAVQRLLQPDDNERKDDSLAKRIMPISHPIIQRSVTPREEIEWEMANPDGMAIIYSSPEARVMLWNFAVGSDRLKCEHITALNRVVLSAGDVLWSVFAEGHTSNSGTPSRNQEISERRARMVERYLESRGINVTSIGFGDTEPWFPNTTAENMARNRRVVLRWAVQT